MDHEKEAERGYSAGIFPAWSRIYWKRPGVQLDKTKQRAVLFLLPWRFSDFYLCKSC